MAIVLCACLFVAPPSAADVFEIEPGGGGDFVTIQDAIDAARAESASAAAKRDRRRRKHLMEGSFADAANNHGFKRSRWRRLWRQQIQDYLIAAVQNIRILLRHGRLRESGTQVRAGGFTAAARHSVLTFWRALWAVVRAVGAAVAPGWVIDPTPGC